MSLVNYDELEGNIADDIVVVKQEDFIASDEYLELVELRRDSGASHGDVGVIPFVVLDASSAWLAILIIVKDAVHVGPLLYCPFPVLKSGKWSNDKERTLYVLKSVKMVKKSYGLDCLSESHLIS